MVLIRLLIGILLPGPLGMLLLSLFMYITDIAQGVNESIDILTLVYGMFLFSLLSYVFVGIQSIVYSCLMEFIINRFVKNDAAAVGISTLLGALSGLIIGGFGAVIGAMVGLIVGAILRSNYRKVMAHESKIPC